MTGFGKAETTINDKIFQVEIRTLNSKGFDLNVRMPSYLKSKELHIRKDLKEELNRGKIDVYININLPDNLKAHSINQTMAIEYAKQIKSLASVIGESSVDVVQQVLRMPNVLEITEDELDENEWLGVQKMIKEAIQRVNHFRLEEGLKTETELLNALTIIENQLKEIPQYESDRIDGVRKRIKKNIESLTDVDLDENRLEQEIVFYVEKYDLSEEKMRLKAHIDHFNELLEGNEMAKGKKLGFVSQELGREINTIGSKANHAIIQRHVVIMKDNLEQIKEQLANIL